MNTVSSIRKVIPLLVFGLTATALPCINDIDTKRIEQETRFDVRSMVAGRYEVNPPEYYEARIKRIEKELTQGAKNPDLYDDLSAAYERLGKTDKAIKVIQDKLKLKASFTEEDTYRYHANLGTYLAHKALAEAGKKDKTLLKEALNHLEKAVKINPEAHFGREAAQIELVRALAEDLAEPKYFEHSDKTKNAYFGLAVMGAAQESPDVWVLAARHSTYSESDRQLIYFRIAQFRSERKFIFPALQKEYEKGFKNKLEVRELLFALVDNGREFQTNREEFILSQIAEGLHPDTDENFWDGYKETEAYVAPEPPAGFRVPSIILVFGGFAIVIGTFAGLTFGLRWLFTSSKHA